MSSKFITALIILTVAALCAAAAFQYLEMESFGLPQTLQERFFPATPAPAPAEESSAANNANTENSNAENNKTADAAPAAQE